MRIRYALAAAACCALLAAAPPKYPGLQYDEIVRMVITPATPPPPGSFADAYRQIVSQAPAGEPPKRQGLGNLLGGLANMEQTANRMQAAIQNGTLRRVAYYKGWVRTDDVVSKTATIEKCSEHQVIQLDLAHKTYRIADTQAASSQACPAPQMPEQSGQQVVNEAPGTADLRITSTGSALAPMTLEQIPTTGSANTTQIAMTNATGSCKNGSFTVETTRYVSKIAIPRRYCPLPNARSVPSTPVDVVVRGGCKPSVKGSMAGAYWTQSTDRLEMYSRMAMTSGGEGAGRFQTVTQRGNVTWLTQPKAEALFSIPADFTKAQ